MNIRRLQWWLGGAAICGLGFMGGTRPAVGVEALPLAGHITYPLPAPTKDSTTHEGGHASKEALRASHYAMLRKRLQATQTTTSATTARWWEETE